jgi:hypothetical protein
VNHRALGAILVLASTAAAAEPRQVTVTASPLNLYYPIVEITVELEAAPHVGVALIGGVGRVKSVTGSANLRGRAIQAGGQLNYYLRHRFRGLHAGVEVLDLSIGSGDFTMDDNVAGEGLSISPLVGYKVLRRSGFTFIAQVGVQLVAITTEALADKRRYAPNINLNVGWSF